MFDWLRRVFGRAGGEEHQRFYETLDALNAHAGGGKPVTVKRRFGCLKVRSGTLVLGDPQYIPDLEVPNIAASEVAISAKLWQYPSGMETVKSLRLRLGEQTGSARRKIGQVGIDSAKLVVADKADIEEHWTEIGKDRIGLISTVRDDTVLHLLTKRFKIKTTRADPLQAQVVGPVSEDLEAEINAFLQADRRYSNFTFSHFHVQTNNSFDRANFMRGAWQFMPVGNSPEPLMFVCDTGRGDGCYDVKGQFEGDIPRSLTITFIDD